MRDLLADERSSQGPGFPLRVLVDCLDDASEREEREEERKQVGRGQRLRNVCRSSPHPQKRIEKVVSFVRKGLQCQSIYWGPVWFARISPTVGSQGHKTTTYLDHFKSTY